MPAASSPPIPAGAAITDDLVGAKQASALQSGVSKGASSFKEPKTSDQIGSQESDSFYKMYNKEIKVN